MGGNREGHVFPRVMPNYLQQAGAPADSLSALHPLLCVLEGQPLGIATVGSLALWIPMGGNSRGSKAVLSECLLTELMGFIIKIGKGSQSRELLLLNLAILADAVGLIGKFGKWQGMWMDSVI